MPPPDQRPASLDLRLARSLEGIDQAARKIVSGEVALDPDATLDSLDLGTRVLEDVLAELMTVTSEELHRATSVVDLAALVREEAERLGRSHKSPLVLDLKLPRDLPRVSTPEPALREVVRDLLCLGAAAAGHGGTLAILGRREGDEVGLMLEAQGGENPSDPPPVALEDLVTTLSGRLHAERSQDGTFRACLVLPSTVAQ